jgi:hypothetical protein
MKPSRSSWLRAGILAAAVVPLGAIVLTGSMQARGQFPPRPGLPNMPNPGFPGRPGGLPGFPGNPGFPRNPGIPNPGFPRNPGMPGMPDFGKPNFPQMPQVKMPQMPQIQIPRHELVWKCNTCGTVLGRVADGVRPTRCTNPNCPSNRGNGGAPNFGQPPRGNPPVQPPQMPNNPPGAVGGGQPPMPNPPQFQMPPRQQIPDNHEPINFRDEDVISALTDSGAYKWGLFGGLGAGLVLVAGMAAFVIRLLNGG